VPLKKRVQILILRCRLLPPRMSVYSEADFQRTRPLTVSVEFRYRHLSLLTSCFGLHDVHCFSIRSFAA